MDKPFCYNPHNFIFVDIDDNSTPGIMPCCTYGRHIPEAKFLNSQGQEATSLKDYLSSNKLYELKSHFLLNNSFPDVGCLSCKKKEEQGLTSLRQMYRRNSENHAFDDKIKYIEIMMDRQCNMACFMCVPESSSTLANEYKALGWLDQVPKGNTYSIISELDSLPDNIRLNVLGGEPFMSKHFRKLLDVAVRKNWSLGITTNGSLINPKILKMLDQIKKIDLTISVDGTGELYSLMRWPNDWQTFETNFKTFRSLIESKKGLKYLIKSEPTIKQNLHINYVAQVLNIIDLPNIINWSKDQKVYLRLSAVLYENSWAGWFILNKEERSNLIQWLKEFINNNEIFNYQKKEILGWIKFLETTTTDYVAREKFLDRIPKILKHRGLDISLATKNLFYSDELKREMTIRYGRL